MILRLHNIFVQKIVHESLKVYDVFYKIFCVQCGLSKVSLLVSLVAGFLESTFSILSVVQTVNGTIGYNKVLAGRYKSSTKICYLVKYDTFDCTDCT